MSKRSLFCQSRLCGRQLCQVAIIPLFWLTRIRFHCFYLLFGLLGVCRRNRLLPDWRSRFAHRATYLRLALWRVARSRRNRRIFSRYCSRLSGLLVLWNRFCPGFPLRFGFCFRQPVGCLFCQMADFLHGMVGGIRDLAALVAIFRLPILCCVAQLLPKLLKGSICAAAECCLRRGFEGFDGSRFQRRFFFYLPHYDACSTRSDSFVVISWYSLPFFGK